MGSGGGVIWRRWVVRRWRWIIIGRWLLEIGLGGNNACSFKGVKGYKYLRGMGRVRVVFPFKIVFVFKVEIFSTPTPPVPSPATFLAPKIPNLS